MHPPFACTLHHTAPPCRSCSPFRSTTNRTILGISLGRSSLGSVLRSGRFFLRIVCLSDSHRTQQPPLAGDPSRASRHTDLVDHFPRRSKTQTHECSRTARSRTAAPSPPITADCTGIDHAAAAADKLQCLCASEVRRASAVYVMCSLARANIDLLPNLFALLSAEPVNHLPSTDTSHHHGLALLSLFTAHCCSSAHDPPPTCSYLFLSPEHSPPPAAIRRPASRLPPP